VIDRRAFLTTVGAGIVAAPLAAEAQQTRKVYRVGLLMVPSPPASSDPTFAAVSLPTILRELGYAEGENLVIDRRFAEGKLDRLPRLALELVALRADVIVAISNDAIRAAKAATQTLPIVILGDSVVEEGIVTSLAQPGANITGFVIYASGIAAKRLQLLTEAVPQVTRVGVLAPGESVVYRGTQLRDAENAAKALGVTLVVVEASNAAYERAFASMVGGGARAVFVVASPLLHRDRTRIIALAAKHRLPAIYEWREHTEEGGLMSYGSSLMRLHRRIATYVDRILKGANPATLPIEQPTLYELVINLTTAKALGLTIPPSLLGRADHVIR
jgi:putative ABC transport system substrate-binding protein